MPVDKDSPASADDLRRMLRRLFHQLEEEPMSQDLNDLATELERVLAEQDTAHDPDK